jgi:hypothetical protein
MSSGGLRVFRGLVAQKILTSPKEDPASYQFRMECDEYFLQIENGPISVGLKVFN